MPFILKLLAKLGPRLKEPSTYAGLATAAAAAGIAFPDTINQTIYVTGIFIGGLLSIFLPENKA
jgi:hypothetical protein